MAKTTLTTKILGAFIAAGMCMSIINAATRAADEPKAASAPASTKADDEAAAKEKADRKARQLRTAAYVVKLQDSARDPDSFKLEEVMYTEKDAICVVYRAKNGFGGYVRGIAVLTPAGKSSDAPSVFKRHCVDPAPKGWDMMRK